MRRIARMAIDNDDGDDNAFTVIFAKAALLFLDNQADEHQQRGDVQNERDAVTEKC